MLKKALATMALIGSIVTYASTPRFSQDRLVVKINEGSQLPHSELIKSSQLLFNNFYIVNTDNLKALEAFLSKQEAVNKIEKDYFSERTPLPFPENEEKLAPSTDKSNKVFNDPGLRKLWAFQNINKNGMSVTSAYEDLGQTRGEEIIVAVVDTGVDYNHEDLKANMWINKGEVPGNGIDDDQNGYIDDIHGINTLVRDENGKATTHVFDGHSHGTHVSGTIAAVQNNRTGIAGVASNVKIMGLRTVPNRGDETDIDVAEAFLYAAKNGARIINCSFGKANNERGMLVKETIDFIGKEYGVLVVASAGNSSQNIDKRLTYPASFESTNLMVVASTTNWGRLSGFSNYGLKNVDIAAPGSKIYSTTPNARYGNMSGTSMASPNAAGVAAEVLSHNPDLTAEELKKVLMDSVTRVGKYADKMASGGLINLREALK
jgi:subtilisin family serine protease